MKPKLLILDRDGTLIVEPPEDYQVDSLEKLGFLPGVIRNLHAISQRGEYEFVMITNQDGLGTQSFPEETFWPAHNKMMNILEGEGITFRTVHIDRTFKHENAETRKPGTALLKEYMDGSFDLEGSFVVGDRPSDIMLAKNLGAKGILLGRSEDQQDDDVDWANLRETLALECDHWDEINSFLSSNTHRSALIERNTKETKIRIALALDGQGKSDIKTGIGFFDHMLDQLARHSLVDLEIETQGDLHIDAHHTIEDTAIALGQAFSQALGSKKGIFRYGCFQLAMDEALAEVALDFSGRGFLTYKDMLAADRVGEMPTQMVEHFFQSFAAHSGCSLHIKLSGTNDHHQIEAGFKGFAKAIRQAIAWDNRFSGLPSTKGIL